MSNNKTLPIPKPIKEKPLAPPKPIREEEPEIVKQKGRKYKIQRLPEQFPKYRTKPKKTYKIGYPILSKADELKFKRIFSAKEGKFAKRRKQLSKLFKGTKRAKRRRKGSPQTVTIRIKGYKQHKNYKIGKRRHHFRRKKYRRKKGWW